MSGHVSLSCLGLQVLLYNWLFCAGRGQYGRREDMKRGVGGGCKKTGGGGGGEGEVARIFCTKRACDTVCSALQVLVLFTFVALVFDVTMRSRT